MSGGISAGTMIAAVGAGLSAVQMISSMGKKAPSAPTIAAPTVMPAPDDEATKDAKRRSLAGQLQRKGRQSTILSDPVSSDLLGG